MIKRAVTGLTMTGLVLAMILATASPLAAQPITQEEVLEAEKAWGLGIVEIGRVYQSGGDYRAAAEQMIDRLYGYAEGPVLFKPTKAALDEFRETRDEAVSYFVTGVDAEDHGFALQPWSHVRLVNNQIIINQDSAEAMGDYYFTDANTGEQVKVDFTLGYKRAADGRLVLFLHHSSLPYQP
jgi:hypothetical protein